MRTHKLIGGAALAVLVIQPLAVPLHAGVAVSIGQNFTGYSNTVDVNPDPAAAAGSNYVVELVRGAFTAYNKADGSVAQTMSLLDFWRSAGVTNFSSLCCFNARVVYDG